MCVQYPSKGVCVTVYDFESCREFLLCKSAKESTAAKVFSSNQAKQLPLGVASNNIHLGPLTSVYYKGIPNLICHCRTDFVAIIELRYLCFTWRSFF